MTRHKIDQLEARWYGVAAPAAIRSLLPDHPWLADPDLRKSGLVIAGASWLVCADLLAEPVDRLPFFRRPLIAVCGLASMAQYQGEQLDPASLASYDGYTGRLELIRTGTQLRLADVSGWVDWNFPSVGTFIHFAVPDGRTFALHTHEASEIKREPEIWEEGLEWWRLACAAVIVPAAHPFASNQALADDALARIETAASTALAARPSTAATVPS